MKGGNMDFVVFLGSILALVLVWRGIAKAMRAKGRHAVARHFLGAVFGVGAWFFVIVVAIAIGVIGPEGRARPEAERSPPAQASRAESATPSAQASATQPDPEEDQTPERRLLDGKVPEALKGSFTADEKVSVERGVLTVKMVNLRELASGFSPGVLVQMMCSSLWEATTESKPAPWSGVNMLRITNAAGTQGFELDVGDRECAAMGKMKFDESKNYVTSRTRPFGKVEPEPAKRVATLDLTPRQYVDRLNANLRTADLPFRAKVNTIERGVMKSMLSDNLGLIVMVDESSGRLREVVMLASGDGTPVSGAHAMMLGVAAISAAIPGSRMDDGLGKLTLEMLSEAIDSGETVKRVRNDTQISVSRNDLVGVMFTARPADP